MILEDETFEAFGYYPSKLSLQNHKRILAACDGCGKVRIIFKYNYYALCNSCSKKSNTNALGFKHTDEAKAKISASLNGNIHALGYTQTEEHKANISAAIKGDKHPNFGKRGVEAAGYTGGKKVSNARNNAKRKQQLGYTLLMPLAEGEVGHHVTNEYIIGIPAEVHRHFGGRSRKKHRTLVLQWLKANDKKKYKMVLCVLAKEPFSKCSNSTQKKEGNSKVPDSYID